jgi:TPR repeat protein
MSIRDVILSARVVGIVMNFPLYDGKVSDKARQLIADGKLDEALAEYRRLSDLGSGMAKCVLAYLNLRGLPRAMPDLKTAKELASAALRSEPGYANYILAYVAQFEKNVDKSIDLMYLSYRARFIPAASALGLICGQGYGVAKDPKKAEIFFWRAIRAGHVPALYLLCRLCMRGDCGVVKRILAILVSPVVFIYLWICSRFLTFSIYTFRHFNVTVPPMFNERGLRA